MNYAHVSFIIFSPFLHMPYTLPFAYTALSKSPHTTNYKLHLFAWNFYDYVSAFIDFARVLLFYLPSSFCFFLKNRGDFRRQWREWKWNLIESWGKGENYFVKLFRVKIFLSVLKNVQGMGSFWFLNF